MKRKNAFAVFLFLLSLALTSHASVPDQPFMQTARTDLQKAKAALQRAEHNKGGHRANAISLINSAIQEVNLGMNYDRGHGRRRYESDLNGSDDFVKIQPVAVDQPNMRDALKHLENAKQSLLSATADKGGHRQKAIDLVNRAINEVNRGITAGNRSALPKSHEQQPFQLGAGFSWRRLAPPASCLI